MQITIDMSDDAIKELLAGYIRKDFRERIKYFYRRHGTTVSKEVVFYLVQANEDEEVKISDEHVGFEWLSYQQAYKRLTYKNAKDILRKAERCLSRV